MSDQTLKLIALVVVGYVVWSNRSTIRGWLGI